MMEYWTLNADNIEDVVAKIADDGYRFGKPGPLPLLKYFQRELERADLRNNELVVYKKDGQWKHLDINRRYNVDFVMTHAEDRL